MSSVNVHGDKAHARSCVHLEVGSERRDVYLVAASSLEASDWVADLRAVLSLDDELSGPATPTIQPSRSRFSATVRTLDSGRSGSNAGGSREPSPQSSVSVASAGSSPSTPLSVGDSAHSTGVVSASQAREVSSGGRSGGTIAKLGPWSRLRGGSKPSMATSLAAATEQFARSSKQSHEEMTAMTAMMQEALRAKDEQRAAVERLLDAETTVAREARGRAELLQTRLENEAASAAAALDKTVSELTAANASLVTVRARLDATTKRAEWESDRADKAETSLSASQARAETLDTELKDTRVKAAEAETAHAEEAAELREKLVKAAAVERELRTSLDTAKSRAEELAKLRHNETTELERQLSEARGALEAAEERAARAALTAAEALAAEQHRHEEYVAAAEEKERKRRSGFIRWLKSASSGPSARTRWSSRRNGASSKMMSVERQRLEQVVERDAVSPVASGDYPAAAVVCTGTPLSEEVLPLSPVGTEFASAQASPCGLVDEDNPDQMSEYDSMDRAAAEVVRGLMMGEAGTGVMGEGETQVTPEAAIIRRRLFHGLAGSQGVFSADDVIDHLDSPGMHGCRQM